MKVLIFVAICQLFAISENTVDACAGKMKVAKKKCLHRSSPVATAERGVQSAGNLHIGDLVQAYDAVDTNWRWSRIVRIDNDEPNARREFARLTTADGGHVTVTPEHGVLVKECGSNATSWSLVPAGRAPVDFCMPGVKAGHATVDEVRLASKTLFVDYGIVQPITESGTIVINGLVVSCFDSNETVVDKNETPLSLACYFSTGFVAILTFLIAFEKLRF